MAAWLRGTTRDRRLAALAAAALGLAPAIAWGMSMSKFCLFSAVEGVVLDHGEPVAGASIERAYKWVWKDEQGHDETTSTPDGRFSLPEIRGSSFFGSFLPHEPIVKQSIVIHHGGKDYEAWIYDKRNYEVNGELDGRPIRLRCDLATEDKEGGEIYGICRLE